METKIESFGAKPSAGEVAQQVDAGGVPGCCSFSDFHIDAECTIGSSTLTTQYVTAYLQDADECTDYAFTVVNEELVF